MNHLRAGMSVNRAQRKYLNKREKSIGCKEAGFVLFIKCV
jgi:hypothetical protein